uniref:Uncharacterized protein n=1 Tax=Dulem virus 29 TaxID=3145747 RepID=A0AAU8B3K4_9CAUD
MKKYKFVFAGKILGYYRELDNSNAEQKKIQLFIRLQQRNGLNKTLKSV